MWKPPPPERVRHALPIARHPTVAEAAEAQLFAPLTLQSGLRLASRTWVPAMVPWRASEDGFVTPAVIAWYRRLAEGQPAALVIEATGIRDVPSGPLLRIGDDRFLPGLSELTRTVREASEGQTRLLVQIIDFLRIRRRPERDRYFAQFLRTSADHHARLADHLGDESWHGATDAQLRSRLAALPDDALAAVLTPRELESLHMGERERVTDVHLSHIRTLPVELPGLFAAAAGRARAAGFDGVELHYAHAYTMASLLSAHNDRADGYGTTLEGRLRLPLEVLAAVRAEVGQDFTVGARILAEEAIEGGTGVDDAAAIGVHLAAAGLDVLSLSAGGKFEDAKPPKVGEAAYPYTGPSGFACMPTALGDARGPFARNVAAQARIRAAIRAAGLTTPTVAAGGLCEFSQVEGILARGEADLIGAARQTLADPDWFLKLRRGRGDAIRRCTYTNYCEALDQRHRAVTCKLWDRQDLGAPGVLTTDDGRRRLVAPAWGEEDGNGCG